MRDSDFVFETKDIFVLDEDESYDLTSGNELCIPTRLYRCNNLFNLTCQFSSSDRQSTFDANLFLTLTRYGLLSRQIK